MVRGRQDPRVSSKYKKARLVVLARDGYTCAYCGQDATTVISPLSWIVVASPFLIKVSSLILEVSIFHRTRVRANMGYID